MKRITMVLISALAAGALLSGCEGGESSSPSEIIGSDVSQTEENRAFPAQVCGVELEKSVEKAVSLSPAATEIICELGFADRLVGVSDYCDYPDNLSAPKLGSPENPNIDEIMRLMPDAVFTISPLSERETYLLNQANIKVLELPVATSIQGYSDLYAEISAAFYGYETIGEKGGRKSAQIADDARKALEKSAEGVALGKFIYVTGKLTIAGADTFESSILSLAGENVCTENGYMSAEAFSGDTPEFIIADNALSEGEIGSDSTLKAMIAEGAKVCFVNPRAFERPSARTAEVFAELRDATSE